MPAQGHIVLVRELNHPNGNKKVKIIIVIYFTNRRNFKVIGVTVVCNVVFHICRVVLLAVLLTKCE